MAVFLALCSAAVVGSGDFFGGFASRHTTAVTAAMYSNGVGALFFIIAAPIAGGSLINNDIWWSTAAGVAGALGIVVLYRGIGAARVSIVSPSTGVGAATVPVIASTLTDDAISAVAGFGIGLGLIAIVLVSQGSSADSGSVRTSLLYGAGAGLGLGLMLTALAQTSGDAGLWPLLPARLAGTATIIAIVLLLGQPRLLPRAAAPPAIGSGVLSAGGNAFFLAGTQVGSLATVTVLTSMFPAVTVLWARVVFKERLRPLQFVGLAVALVSVGLIAGG